MRALRYYEQVGLIHPAREGNGYREYEEGEIERVRLIRAYRELQFSLDEITSLLDAPRTERDRMLEQKISEMELKRRQIDNRIALAQSIRMIGPQRLTEIDFDHLDDQMEQSRKFMEQDAEMQAIGNRLKHVSKEKADAITAELINIMAEIANTPENNLNAVIQNLKNCVEKYFYPCTDTILTAYARAYGGDGILAQAVDEVGGTGAAQRMRKRLESWLKENIQL